MQEDANTVKNKIKRNIQVLLDKRNLEEAKELIEQYKSIIKDDLEVYSMNAVILIMEGKLREAEDILKEGLSIDSNDFDLNYNLAYIYNETEKFTMALEHYDKAQSNCNDKNLKSQISSTIHEIKDKHPEVVNYNRGNCSGINNIKFY